MSYVNDQQQNTGLYVATTNVWDVDRLYEVDIGSPDFKELLVRLYQNVNNISLSLNNKDSAYYLLEEFNTGQNFFNAASNSQLDLRPVFRKVLNIGALGAGVTTTAHGLTIGSTWSFTRIYGTASLYNAVPANSNYYPIPWASAGGATNIEIKVNGTNVVITNNSGVAFTTCTVVLEYVKS